MDSRETAHHTSRFKVFHDLMQKKVEQVLLISTSYEAWIMEEDCRLSEHIVHEYKGLNLSRPPRLTWVSSTRRALEALARSRFDLVVIIARAADARTGKVARQIKTQAPQMPVILFTHQESLPDDAWHTGRPADGVDCIDRAIFWTGDAALLLAVIKSIEDQLNVVHDTQRAGIRIILLVEDSPFYLSTLLPVIYRELVIETQAVIDEGLNEEHRLLSMRARPKILIAGTFEKALTIYERYRNNILGVISDVRYPRGKKPDARAGLDLLAHIRADRFDIPLLLASSEPNNADWAARIPARFIDKNSAALGEEIRSFLMEQLGFGDFVFRMPDGRPIATATDLYTLELELARIPNEAFEFHCRRNDFSRWLYSLAEVDLASRVRELRVENFDTVEEHRRHLVQTIRRQRIERQKGVIVNFDPERFDPDTEFLKIGKGSLGGKARGLAFISSMIHRRAFDGPVFERVDLHVPQTVAITTEGFDDFLEGNRLKDVVNQDLPDDEITNRFIQADLPETVQTCLAAFLKHVDGPLAVRSSSLLEDAQYKSYAGLYKTYLLANGHRDPLCRLDQLTQAVKMVYASTFSEAPRAFARRVGHRIENEKMGVVVQQMAGCRYKNHFYPAISGVAQSVNYYPFSKMKPVDGIASIALGLGREVMGGSRSLSFSPRHPKILPQRSTVEDILKYSQTRFYTLKMDAEANSLGTDEASTLVIRDLVDAMGEHPIRALASTYIPEEHRIRDGFMAPGHPVLTFASILKYAVVPVPEILRRLLAFGSRELGCPVEIEFAVDLPESPDEKARFAVLQIRPMSAREEMLAVEIDAADRSRAVCTSQHALGNTIDATMTDIVYVKPDAFDPARTEDIAGQIAGINAMLIKKNRKFILIGPGRWGSADRWLGIPVGWADICGVGAIVETVHPDIHADPSQGSHFFHNITTLGISYLNVGDAGGGGRMDWTWLLSLAEIEATDHVAWVASPSAVELRVDGRSGAGVILASGSGGSSQEGRFERH